MIEELIVSTHSIFSASVLASSLDAEETLRLLKLIEKDVRKAAGEIQRLGIELVPADDLYEEGERILVEVDRLLKSGEIESLISSLGVDAFPVLKRVVAAPYDPFILLRGEGIKVPAGLYADGELFIALLDPLVIKEELLHAYLTSLTRDPGLQERVVDFLLYEGKIRREYMELETYKKLVGESLSLREIACLLSR